MPHDCDTQSPPSGREILRTLALTRRGDAGLAKIIGVTSHQLAAFTAGGELPSDALRKLAVEFYPGGEISYHATLDVLVNSTFLDTTLERTDA